MIQNHLQPAKKSLHKHDDYMDQPTGRSINQKSSDQSIIRLIDRSTDRPPNQSINQSISHLYKLIDNIAHIQVFLSQKINMLDTPYNLSGTQNCILFLTVLRPTH